MSPALWEFVDSEPFMVNPSYFSNPHSRKSPKRKKTVMKYKKNSSRRRVYRRRAARRNAPGLVLANPHKRRSSSRRSYRRRSFKTNPARRRHPRRNPPTIAGIKLVEILYCGGAVIAAPFLENQIRPHLPASLQTGTTGRWVVKVGVAAGVWQIWGMMFGRHIGDLTGLVLGSNLLSDAASEFMPTLTGGTAAAALAGYRTLPQRGLSGYLGVNQGGARRGAIAPRRAFAMPGPLDSTY